MSLTLLTAGAAITTLSGVLYKHWLRLKNIDSYVSDGDYISQSSALRVEPITAVSHDLLNHEDIDNVLKANLMLVSSFYSAAMQMRGVIKDVKVLKTLNSLNPDPSLDSFSTESSTGFIPENYGIEEGDYEHGLPTSRSLENSNIFKSVSVDEGGDETKIFGKEIQIDLADLEERDADGKPINKSYSIKVLLRLTAKFVSNNTLTAVMTQFDKSKTMSERWKAVKSGRISFIKDFIFNMDLYEERKKLMMSDDVGFYETIMDRSNKSKIIGGLSSNPGMAEATNVYIISEVVERDIEKKLRGRFTSAKVRGRIFDITKAMLITVVDRDREKAIIWYRGLSEPTVISLSKLKSKSKKLDDMYEIIKSLAAYKAPSF